jgi:ketosteroid isomerase-like protein
MTDRLSIDRLLHHLYAARARGDLEAVCGAFSHDAEFRIAGASYASPVKIAAFGMEELRPWLALLVKSFKLSDYKILSLIIEGPKAAVHWRAVIHSRITGISATTELCAFVQFRDNRIVSYIEFFVPVSGG